MTHYLELCYICLENLESNMDHNYVLKCGCFNRYHITCLDTWLSIQNKCPTCKKKINETQNSNDYIHDDFDLEVDDNDIFYNPLVHFILYFIFVNILYCILYHCYYF